MDDVLAAGVTILNDLANVGCELASVTAVAFGGTARARLCWEPAAMAIPPVSLPVGSVGLITCTGVGLIPPKFEPLPNSPAPLLPQAQIVPSLLSAEL